jgi:dTDP-4-amino-4,6-dideoxygalactose transaminase
MIPRTKVNYGSVDLLRALLVREDGAPRRALAQQLAAVMGVSQVLLTPSGRGGLYHILRALDLPRVVIPTYTCKAVAEAALLAGKEVVYAEVESDGFNMTPEALGDIVDDRCAVIATHQFGIPCDIETIVRLCRDRRALVIEDVAAALGTRINGRLAGTFGDAAFFSFDSTKLINVPMKAGFVIARDPALFARIRAGYEQMVRPMPSCHKWVLIAQALVLLALENPWLYRAFHWLMFDRRGRFTTDSPDMARQLNPFYYYDVADWQVAIARTQLEHIDEIVATRRRIYRFFQDRLRGCRSFVLPPEDVREDWACIRFPIRIRGDKLAFYQRAVRRGLDFAFSFTFLSCGDRYPNSTRLARSVLDLPFYLKLSGREREQVVGLLREVDRECADESLGPGGDDSQPAPSQGDLQPAGLLGRQGN